jgi:hypothetical protein
MFGTLQSGQILLGDRAYDSDGLRESLAERGAVANIRPMPSRTRLPPFDTAPLCRIRKITAELWPRVDFPPELGATEVSIILVG